MSFYSVLLILLAATISCNSQQKYSSSAPTVSTPKKQESVPMPNPDKPQNYYYEMKEEDLRSFSVKVERVQIGAPLNQVLDTLGKPDVEHNSIGKQPPDAKVKKIIRYYAKIWEQGLINEKHDRYVSFYFDSSDHLLEIDSNIKGIRSR